MSCSCQSTDPQLCGCCTGVADLTPAAIANRPGLPAIHYRVGTYSTFLQSMQAALSSANLAPLAALRTRSPQDFSIALLDAWSEVLDVLTFYTERLANEAYLGTAIEPRSVFELARLVGYKPSPGVSASTVLAFTLASAAGSPVKVPISSGTRVQSVPGPGQSPQVFETSAPINATIAANAIPAVVTTPWTLFGSDTSTWIAGTANNIHIGDALLFISAPGGIPSPSGPAAVVYVTGATLDPIGGNTFLSWNKPLPASLGSSSVCIYIFRTKAALYGASSPKPGMFPTDSLKTIPGTPGSGVTSTSDWAWQYGENLTVNLDNAYPGLNPAASGPSAPAAQSQWMILTGPQYTSFFQVASVSESNPGLYALSLKTTQITLDSGTVLAGDPFLTLNELLYLFVQETRVTTAYVQSQLLTGANLPLTQWPLSSPYPLAAGMLAPISGSSLVVQGLQTLTVNAPVAVNGKRLRITPNIAIAAPDGGFTPGGATGMLPVGPNQQFLIDAFPPQTDPSGNLLWSVITVTPPAGGTNPSATVAGQPGILTLPPGSFTLLPSVASDPATGEAAVLSDVTIQNAAGTSTAITFNSDLTRIYDAATVTVNANAVLATHGETVQEILGSGDASNAALALQLKQSPLTYVSAATSSGVQSTLEVRINNLLWSEVDNFLDSEPSDRVYVTRPNSTGGPTVQFGDGLHGSRTPTAQSNIVAKYRKGIGIGGMVAAGQLTQPLDRPQGLQSVTNPSAATGGADPASPANARLSAPLPTLTLGRIVSLEDYQNFALNFAGIALAVATWTWFGSTRSIFLTLAGEGGAVLTDNDQVVQNLLLAFQQYGLPYVPVQIVSYTPVLFEISMQLKIDTPTYDPAIVIPAVWQSLASTYAFGQMSPGRGVAASQVIQLAQQVAGVVAVNLIGLNRRGDAPALANILCAAGPRPTAQPPAGAEILLLDPASQANLGVWS
ncbi:putative baseplate assembly protein [Acidobacteria bacterium AB60]|nr:putative baseplate assembly protein [Acidobacteria bacterium AB60]